MILTINPTVPSCVEFTSDTYWQENSGTITWDGSQWNIGSVGPDLSRVEDGSPAWFNGFRPSYAVITYGVPTGTTHDWRFRFFDAPGDGFNTLGDSGLISDPGTGTFQVTIPLDFTGAGDINELDMTWSGYNATGFISKIEFCS